MSMLLASLQLIPLLLVTPKLLLASLLLLRVRDVPKMSAVNGVSAGVDIMPLPSLIGDSAVIGVSAMAGFPVV
jgi:hypothetical protein